MRDLMRKYKVIIKDKLKSDTDSEQILSTTKSSDYKSNYIQGAKLKTLYQTAKNYYISSSIEIVGQHIFKEDRYNAVTDEEHYPTNNSSTNCNITIHTRKVFLSRSMNMEKQNNLYDILHPSSNDLESENANLLPMKHIMNKSFPKDTSNTNRCNNSLVTIFAVWNTTVGTSLLAMAWGMDKTGLVPGILINLLVAGVCLYTAYVLLKINQKYVALGEPSFYRQYRVLANYPQQTYYGNPYADHRYRSSDSDVYITDRNGRTFVQSGDSYRGLNEENFEVPDLCRILIGRWAEIVSKIFSLIVLIGCNIVYWILMTNFLYNIVIFAHDYITQVRGEIEMTVLCPKENIFTNQTIALENSSSSIFYTVWDLYSTVPIFLALMLFPFLNFKNPTFFTKFNSLGTLSVTYLIVFVAIKSTNWGINIQSWSNEFHIKSTFCVLSGMLGMSYFIHNVIISIMKQNKDQKHNERDLTIAFGLVTFTYIFLGASFYISFPLKKTCIEDNLLINFAKNDAMALIARVLLFFQLFTVFPFVTYMLRNDVLSCINMIIGKEPNCTVSYTKTVLINVLTTSICIMFACFMPKIGTLIRYTGALSGLVYIFVMPSLLELESLKREGSLTIKAVCIHIAIIIFGVLNLISQFLIEE